MTMGAERADAQPETGTGEEFHEGWHDQATDESFGHDEWREKPEAPRRSTGKTILAAALIALAVGWIGSCLWLIALERPTLSFPLLLSWVPTLSIPLILFGVTWLLFGRTHRRETERFTRAVSAMRGESQALESLLAIIAGRLEENKALLGDEAARLMALGDEASDRLGRVAHYLARQTADLDRKSQALEAAAANAKVDIGVLLHDLPRAEEQARAVASAMSEAGITAHERAGALEGQLSALIARSREADETVGGAAQRLGAQLARIESSAGAASDRMEGAAAGMSAAVDGAMERASQALETTRTSLDDQGAAMLAMIEQSRAAFEQAAGQAANSVAMRLEAIGAKLHELTGHIAEQDRTSRGMLARLGASVDALDQRLEDVSRSGGDRSEQLREAVESVRASVRALEAEVDGGQERTSALIERSVSLGQSLEAVSTQLRSELPQALAGVEEQAGRTSRAAEAALPTVEALQGAAAVAADRLGESEQSVVRQQQALDRLLTAVETGTERAEEQLRALNAAVTEVDGAAAKLAEQTGPQLVEALVRVRESANQAALHAREAIAAVIPESVAALAEASRDAVGEAVTEPVQDQLIQLKAVSEGAIATARKASERLTRQLLTIGETAAAIESRIDEARAEREEQESESFSRRVALLIESLNSTAIDVTKILSNEVTDSAWAAYLKGDRGVFTRRAVRLLDSGEAREIARHYDEEPEFREQVNRYIHDFEAMLRRILADRDGTPLSITLLSSDMGKLYVALAQAIERLRH